MYNSLILIVAMREGRNFIGIEKNKDVELFKNKPVDHIKISKDRIKAEKEKLELNKVEAFNKLKKTNLLK